MSTYDESEAGTMQDESAPALSCADCMFCIQGQPSRNLRMQSMAHTVMRFQGMLARDDPEERAKPFHDELLESHLIALSRGGPFLGECLASGILPVLIRCAQERTPLMAYNALQTMTFALKGDENINFFDGFTEESFDAATIALTHPYSSVRYLGAILTSYLVLFLPNGSVQWLQQADIAPLCRQLVGLLQQQPERFADELQDRVPNDVHIVDAQAQHSGAQIVWHGRDSWWCSHQNDLPDFRRFESAEEAAEYAPRYTEMMHEHAATAIRSLLMRALLEENMELSEKVLDGGGDQMVQTLLDVAEHSQYHPPECYPDSEAPISATQAIASLCHALPQRMLQFQGTDGESMLSNIASILGEAMPQDGFTEETHMIFSMCTPPALAKWHAPNHGHMEMDAMFGVFCSRDMFRANLMDALVALSAAHSDAVAQELSLECVVAELIMRYSNEEDAEGMEQIAEKNIQRHGLSCGHSREFRMQRFVPRVLDAALMVRRRCFPRLSEEAIEVLREDADIEATDAVLDRCAQNRSSARREEGKGWFLRKEYDCAEAVYYQASEIALDGSENKLLCTSNRAECFLKLQQPCEALKAADDSLSMDPQHEKSLSRRKRALSMLGEIAEDLD